MSLRGGPKGVEHYRTPIQGTKLATGAHEYRTNRYWAAKQATSSHRHLECECRSMVENCGGSNARTRDTAESARHHNVSLNEHKKHFELKR
jgi:hypothetical protein